MLRFFFKEKTMNCPQCESPQVAKMGKSSIGAQRYICRNKDCSVKTFSFPYTYRGANPSVKTQVLDMAMNGSGIRDTARVLKIDPNTVMAQIKKKHPLSNK